MPVNFNRPQNLRVFEGWKWNLCEENILPLWIADMDFQAPQAVLDALEERLRHGVFGYVMEPPDLRGVIVQRLQERYDWQVSPEEIVFLPGIMSGVNLACRTFARPGEGALLQTPGYDSILEAPAFAGLTGDEAPLVQDVEGRWQVNLDTFEGAVTPLTRLFIMCNPHNPVGKVFRRDELEAMTSICLRHNLMIVSDEIHSDIIFDGRRHIPIAALDKEVASRCITLMSPGKTYNIPALRCAYAVIQNSELRKAFELARRGLIPGPDPLGYAAALAAYRHGRAWLDELLLHLQSNRDFLSDYLLARIPALRFFPPEGTFLAWIDCRPAGIPLDIHNIRFNRFFYDQAGVAVYNGRFFGQAGEGFIRLNFACSRATLQEGLQRIERSLACRSTCPQ